MSTRSWDLQFPFDHCHRPVAQFHDNALHDLRLRDNSRLKNLGAAGRPVNRHFHEPKRKVQRPVRLDEVRDRRDAFADAVTHNEQQQIALPQVARNGIAKQCLVKLSGARSLCRFRELARLVAADFQWDRLA